VVLVSAGAPHARGHGVLLVLLVSSIVIATLNGVVAVVAIVRGTRDLGRSA
jgi:hypothetical protein